MSDHDQNLDEIEDDGVVTLIDAEGNEVDFGILGFVEHEEQEYILLGPVAQLEDEDEDASLDIYLFKYDVDEDGAENFSEIEDEDVFGAVQEKAEALLTEAGAELDEDEDASADADASE